MQLRSPFGLGECERLADSVLRTTLLRDDAEFNALRSEGDPDNIYDWTVKYHPEVIANAHKTFLPGLIDNEELGGHLINMHWMAVDVSAAQHNVLTADRPFIYTHGWKHPAVALLFPVSPSLIFVATNGADQLSKVRSRSADHLATFTNERVVNYAVDFVIGTDSSQLRFVENRLRPLSREPTPGPIGKGRPGCPT
jgi:hypothetical protein